MEQKESPQFQSNFLMENVSLQESLQKKDPKMTLDQAFYLEATKLHLEANQKIQQIQSIKQEIKGLQKLIDQQTIHKKKNNSYSSNNQSFDANAQRKKRMRRTAVQIARHYICQINNCNKSYGSEGSLNQHMKLKHKNYYTKQMQILDLNRNSLDQHNS